MENSMLFEEKLTQTQKSLHALKWAGWLFNDFRRNNDLACRFLEIPHSTLLTRRFFYYIPAQGTPIKLVHRVESHVLDHLPGTTILYSSWHELESQLKKILPSNGSLAMEYSPHNAIPYVAKVDAGTIDLVRSYGLTIESSADLLQQSTSVWTPYQLQTHLDAAKVLEHTVEQVWEFISSSIASKTSISEWDVQQFMLNEFEKHNCHTDAPPICARNANSSLPHYTPVCNDENIIQEGDFILIDLWCKKKASGSVYADIARVAVVVNQPTLHQQEVFNTVKAARDTGMELIAERLSQGHSISGYEVDQACRDVIIASGYGDYFTHRTGHNIGENDHGDGANIDNFETKDTRKLLPGTGFSIEPGIYLPKEFGIRLEHNVFMEFDGKSFRITGGLQTHLKCLTN